MAAESSAARDSDQRILAVGAETFNAQGGRAPSAAQDRDYRAAVELASFALWLWKEGWRPWTK